MHMYLLSYISIICAIYSLTLHRICCLITSPCSPLIYIYICIHFYPIGTVVKPSKEDILFVPQKPYLVNGTLRDQIIYPHTVADMRAIGVTDDDLVRLLEVVDPAQSIVREWKFDDQRDWFHSFSGGQKQRVAMARVFYHRPR